jgi:hypothetical protein
MDALTAGLIGSIGTVMVTKIIEYFLANKEHTLALKKEHFNRKLVIFEKAISHWTIAYQTLCSMALLFKTIRKEEVAADYFGDIFSRLDMQLQTISKETQGMAIAIGLYTDIEYPDELGWTEKFFTLLGELTTLTNQLKHSYSLLNDPAWKAIEKEIQIHIDNKERALDDKIHALEQMSVNVRDIYIHFTKQLRSEMKKFE